LAAKKKQSRPPKPEPTTDSEPDSAPASADGEEPGLDDDDAIERAAAAAADAGAQDEGFGEPSVESIPSGAITRADPLAAYMAEAQRYPLLTPEEEHRLAVEYTDTGSRLAAERLVTANLRLVVKIAYEYRRAYRNILDLVQEGNIGLMQAVARYDPYRGVKLSSYAAWWIRAYMLRFILNNWRLVKIGTTQAQRKLFFNLNKEKARLAAKGIDPTHELIAQNLEVGVKDVAEMDRRLARGDASLDVPVGDPEGRQTTRMELLPSSSKNPEQTAEGMELAEVVRQHLDVFRETLSGKELEIFDKRVVAVEPLTLQELGDTFGVSRERVRQLEARLISRLRDYLRERLGDAVEVGG
jgi:RNA polymerase sigma-32 factor